MLRSALCCTYSLARAILVVILLLATAHGQPLPRRCCPLTTTTTLPPQEFTIEEVAERFKLPRGALQGLQERAGKSAGMVAAFCERLGWQDLEMLIAKFQVGGWGWGRRYLCLRASCVGAPCTVCLCESHMPVVWWRHVARCQVL